jgi:hypothetical protein
VAISREKVFSANATETVNFTDESSNVGQVTATVTRIDKVAPTILAIDYNPSTATNGNVTVLLATDEPLQLPAGRAQIGTTSYTKTYTDNINESVQLFDLVGNSIET